MIEGMDYLDGGLGREGIKSRRYQSFGNCEREAHRAQSLSLSSALGILRAKEHK